MVVAVTKSVIGFFKENYRKVTTTEYDVYDTIESGTTASMYGTCIFCDIIIDKESGKNGRNKIWFEDD